MPFDRSLPFQDGDYLRIRDISEVARAARVQSGRSKEEAADAIGVTKRVVSQAEEQPYRSLFKVRRRILEFFTGYTLDGPYYKIRKVD